MKNKLLLLLIVLTSCAPDTYQKTDEIQIGYVLSYNPYNSTLPDTFYCTRVNDTYWETACIERHRVRKDTIFRLDFWKFIRFVPYSDAVNKFDTCN